VIADEVLAAFDAQVRRGLGSVSSAVRVERDERVIRCVSVGPGGWAAVVWTDLDRATADEVIAEQVRFYDELGSSFEWKYYAYDNPPDLPNRLETAGFVPDQAEALMVADAEIGALVGGGEDPAGVRIVAVEDDVGVGHFMTAQQGAFGTNHSDVAETLREQMVGPEPAVVGIVALVDGQPVASSRIEFNEGTQFAGLWGGGTVPEWRGRGIYQAMVRCRAQLALRRGYRYLQVDALPTSEPILHRLGFVRLTTTVPFNHSPGS
jgi:hypothetical protein